LDHPEFIVTPLLTGPVGLYIGRVEEPVHHWVWVRFRVPPETYGAQLILSGTILLATQPNRQCQGTEEQNGRLKY